MRRRGRVLRRLFIDFGLQDDRNRADLMRDGREDAGENAGAERGIEQPAKERHRPKERLPVIGDPGARVGGLQLTPDVGRYAFLQSFPQVARRHRPVMVALHPPLQHPA